MQQGRIVNAPSGTHLIPSPAHGKAMAAIRKYRKKP